VPPVATIRRGHLASSPVIRRVARLTGDWLGKRLGQQFIIENRPGAGNNLATETAAPDGYTLMPNPANARNCRLEGPAPGMPVSTCAGRAPPRTLGIG